jgi:hypothetical protein
MVLDNFDLPLVSFDASQHISEFAVRQLTDLLLVQAARWISYGDC